MARPQPRTDDIGIVLLQHAPSAGTLPEALAAGARSAAVPFLVDLLVLHDVTALFSARACGRISMCITHRRHLERGVGPLLSPT